MNQEEWKAMAKTRCFANADFDNPHYLRLTREQPWHPLYLPDKTLPSRWYSKGFTTKNNPKGELTI